MKEKFHRVNNRKYLKEVDNEKHYDDEHVDADKHNVDGTRETLDVTEIGNFDPYLGTELGLNKGDEEGLHFARV